jgi:hypothetical protein
MLAWLGLLEDVRPNNGTFPQSSTGTLVVLRYPTQTVGDFYVKLLRYWLTILMDFSLASDLEIFSKSTNVGHITSKTRCTSAKVSFTWVFWSHWPQQTKHPPVHHPRDARYYSVVDECQLSSYLV